MNLKSLQKTLYKHWGILLLISLSLLFYWRVNVFQEELSRINAQIMADLDSQAELVQKLKEMRPYRIKAQEELDITARAAVSVLVDKDGIEKILFEKDTDQVLPIASISKLMTVYVALNHYEPSQRTNDLVHLILIHSNNWAAEELTQIMGREEFMALMNSTAEELGLENTYFVNPTGLDQTDFNRSTAGDLVKFARHIAEEEPLVWKVSLLEEYRGLVNTNRLLSQVPGIIGGKTGATVKAGECLIFLTEAPNEKGYLINIVLGSAERFEEMEKLLNWVENSYVW